MSESGEIRPHMEVVGADGVHVGTVDRMERGHIKLTRQDDPGGTGRHHHHIPLGAIRMIEGGRVWLTMPAQQARAMAVGGQQPEDMEEGSAATDEAGIARPDRTGVSPMEGGATGNIHGGGRMAPNGGGAGGTAAHSQGSGGGIAHDPNMDPSGRGDPDL